MHDASSRREEKEEEKNYILTAKMSCAFTMVLERNAGDNISLWLCLISINPH